MWSFPEARPVADGPWNAEPDKAQWVDGPTGLDCLIVRNRMGALCGYVGVGPGHPAFEQDYSADLLAGVDVHGGLTFADHCADGKEDGWGICHVPQPGREANVWWFGFDCAHAGDVIPSMLKYPEMAELATWGRYRDFAYVSREVSNLAAQLAALGG